MPVSSFFAFMQCIEKFKKQAEMSSFDLIFRILIAYNITVPEEKELTYKGVDLMKDNRDLAQVYRIDGRNCFCEIMLDGLPYDKVLLNFKSYDLSKAEGTRTVADNSIFMDIYTAEVFARDILSGRMATLAKIARKKAKDAGSKYPEAVFENLGGTPAKRRPDGIALARVLNLVPGVAQPWILCAKQGPGHETKEGLIVMDKQEQLVRVPVASDQKLKEIALSVERVTRLWEQYRFGPVVAPMMETARKRREEAIAQSKAASLRNLQARQS